MSEQMSAEVFGKILQAIRKDGTASAAGGLARNYEEVLEENADLKELLRRIKNGFEGDWWSATEEHKEELVIIFADLSKPLEPDD